MFISCFLLIVDFMFILPRFKAVSSNVRFFSPWHFLFVWHFDEWSIFQNSNIIFHFRNFWQYEWYSLARHWANSLIICAYFCVFSWPMLGVSSFSNSHWLDSNLWHVYFWQKFGKVRIIFRGFFVSFSKSAFPVFRFWLRGIDGCGHFKNVLISVRRRALHVYIKI